jgi:hypothetical protein
VWYEYGLLWKVYNPNVSNKLCAAQRRFFNQETKLIHDKSLTAVYKSVIDTYVNLKHVRKLTKAEIDAGLTVEHGTSLIILSSTQINPENVKESCSTNRLNTKAYV